MKGRGTEKKKTERERERESVEAKIKKESIRKESKEFWRSSSRDRGRTHTPPVPSPCERPVLQEGRERP